MDYTLLIENFAREHAHRGWPRQRLLHECLRSAIRGGTLAAGTRLVATRTLASELGVARNTVLYAYEQLASEGFVTSGKRGTIVAGIAPDDAARRGAEIPQVSLSRRVHDLRPLHNASNRSDAFAPGVPDLEHFPITLWRRMLDRAWRAAGPAQLNYAEAAGEAALREAIADHLRASRGVVCDASQVFITDGSQSSMDLCAQACADAGDTVWIENPGYSGALASFRSATLKIEGIAVDQEGIAPTARDWRERPPRLVYVTPSHQYPIGSVLSLPRRLALIEGARRAGALILEDDYDSEFRHDGAPLSAMQGLAPDAPVIYLGTFSKTMFPALRIAYIVVPKRLSVAMAMLRAQSSLRGRGVEQLALAEFIRSGQFALHLRRMRRLYRQRCDALVAALQTHLGKIAEVHGASSGMHLSLRFRDAALSDVEITRRAMEEGICVNALSRHAIGGRTEWNGLMLGYAQVPAEAMEGLVKRLAAIVHMAAYAANRKA
ncbi:MocR-like pyridoxine biosynthesis transcription factor PdxR [Pseudoduganella violacea]|uniref:GntR family transcriptional regulator/MocR family aminotransferase n=1 Tax=Pseudoduganella violacea TaxID=1715466 RepID=A0A7W5BG47_9BURK|nr:PLP-dependent aminotransferase family protein [Pseudoduganella violacea]MBB3122343.1 GntR family transcriptional regulator/MocR family aminotransferase [Pseudoduganella violacea]